AHLALGDLLERHARRLGVLPRLDLVLRAAIQLARALGGQNHQQVTVGHLLQRFLQGGKRHHCGTSTSGNLSVRRVVRQRSAWMIVASWSTASFTSRLMIKYSYCRQAAISSRARLSRRSISPGASLLRSRSRASRSARDGAMMNTDTASGYR